MHVSARASALATATLVGALLLCAGTLPPPADAGSGPALDTLRGSLYSVSGSSENDAWAVGGRGTNYPLKPKALFVHWDGSAWRAASVTVPGKQSSLLGVSTVDVNDAWAVGWFAPRDARRSLAMHWDGNTWTTTPVPGGKDLLLSAVSGIASDDVWAVGVRVSEPNSSVVLHWDGNGWRTAGTADGYLVSLSAVASDDVWAGGFRIDQKSQARSTVLQHWDGHSWSVTSSPNPDPQRNSLYAVAALPTGDAWAVGAFGGRESKMRTHRDERTLALQWDGTDWTRVKSANPDQAENQLNGVAAGSASDVWAVGHRGSGQQANLIEHWDGTDWTAVASEAPLGSSALLSVAVSGSDNAWAVGFHITGLIRYKPSIEHWDGQSWNLARITSQ